VAQSLFVNATATCTLLFHSISVACYCVLCVRGVGCRDQSLPFVCVLLQLITGRFTRRRLKWKTRGWIRALWQLRCQVSNI